MSQTVQIDELPNGLALERGSALPPGVQFHSASGKANLIFQYDGNLVDYDENSKPRFASNTSNDERGGDGGRTCIFQQDGNLVVYDANKSPIFATNTADDEQFGEGGHTLVVQDDGNVVVYAINGRPLFATNSNH